MEHTWEFRDVCDTEQLVNAGQCAVQAKVNGADLVGFQTGWVARFFQVISNELGDGVTVIVYVERPSAVTSTILGNGRVIEW